MHFELIKRRGPVADDLLNIDAMMFLIEREKLYKILKIQPVIISSEQMDSNPFPRWKATILFATGLTDEMASWLEDRDINVNLITEERYGRIGITGIQFSNDSDATLFKLTWL